MLGRGHQLTAGVEDVQFGVVAVDDRAVAQDPVLAARA
jgi:hypothetical protein